MQPKYTTASRESATKPPKTANFVDTKKHGFLPEEQRERESGSPRYYITNIATPPPDADFQPSDKLFSQYYLQSIARDILPDFRVASCLRARIDGAQYVLLKHDPDRLRAYWGNLITCGSVWVCPVCAGRISEVRREELTLAVAAARELGWYPVLITFTLQHSADDELKHVLASLLDTLRRVRAGSPFKRFRERSGYQGSVSALEMTWSRENGGHPHRHELWFLDHKPTAAELAEMESWLRTRYIKYLQKTGRWASWENGLRVDFDHNDPFGPIAEYIAKFGHEPSPASKGWTIAHELAKAVVKRGRGEHYSPFELLALAAEGDREAREAFAEYAEAFFRRQHLVYSHGLKDKLGLADSQSDEEIAADVDAFNVLLAALGPEAWQRVLKSEKRAELQRAGGCGDIESVMAVLEGLGIKLFTMPDGNGETVRATK